MVVAPDTNFWVPPAVLDEVRSSKIKAAEHDQLVAATSTMPNVLRAVEVAPELASGVQTAHCNQEITPHKIANMTHMCATSESQFPRFDFEGAIKLQSDIVRS